MALALAASRLDALTIIPVFDSTITSDPNSAAIQSAINQTIATYQNTFSTPITVTITFQGTNSGLGMSSKLVYGVTYSSFRTALQNSATTANDTLALNSLPTGSLNPATGGSTMVLTGANLAALGYGGSYVSGGTISLNTSLMNLNRTSIDPAKYDIFAIAAHEINEVLGFGSAIGQSGLPGPLPQDLFRFTSGGSRTFTTSGDDAYFSINGGSTQLARFNQNGAGDYGDWWSLGGHTAGVQDAFGTAGATPNLGIEITALDVIGYTLVTAAVPEPAAVAAWMAAGALGVAGWRRRRTARAASGADRVH
jgi:hypothetical protein